MDSRLNRGRPGRADIPPPRRPLKPIMPVRPQGGSWVVRGVLLALLAAAVYGGYYGHAVYRLGDKRFAFTQRCHALRQTLMAHEDNVGRREIEAVGKRFAREKNVEIIRFSVILEPLDSSNEHMLPSTVRMAIGIAAKLPRHRVPTYLIGYKGRFRVSHGPASREFDAPCHTWFDGKYVDVSDDGDDDQE